MTAKPSATQVLQEIDRLLNASGLAARDPMSFIGLKHRIATLLVQAASGTDVGRAVAAIAPEVARHLGAADADGLRRLMAESTRAGSEGAVTPIRPDNRNGGGSR